MPNALATLVPSIVQSHKVGRPRKHPEVKPFYCDPAEVIAEWCCVTLSAVFA